MSFRGARGVFFWLVACSFFFFSSRRRHTRCREVSWARRCVQETGAENCVGPWVWKSGEIKHSYAVPWAVQSVNTCPDNFLQEKDKTSVIAVADGLYEIKLAVFSARKAAAQVLENGEALLLPIKSISGPEKGKPLLTKLIDKVLSDLSPLDFVSLPS
eukprot:TRINITY_DN58365_c0_g2_i1.p2 TRINITY_DN58365_c0_g2~~TRINITY_DN58365_c0_g2_i1.p2  ORF type:complete len:171 (+),score=35.67 TRINITY_DN58365_c0_g2_i1:41-514(+)